MLRLIALAFVTSSILSFSGCPTGVASEGEGEGEGEGEPEIPTLGPTFGYSATAPGGFTGSCATDQYWQFGDSESEVMHPGGDCIDCHTTRQEGPIADFMGTVFGRLDDGTDCRGIPGVTVTVIDANGARAVEMVSNNAGNFFYEGPTQVALPYTVELSYDGRTRVMAGGQTEMSCNACHTAEGLEGAPGRIQIP